MNEGKVNNFNNIDLRYYILRKKLHFFRVKCYLNLLFWIFLYYFGHTEDVFLFLIYFPGGLFDMIIIDFHWKGLYFSFVVKTFWHDWRKIFLVVSCLFGTTLFVYLWTYLDFHWKLKFLLYETTLSFIMNLLKS